MWQVFRIPDFLCVRNISDGMVLEESASLVPVMQKPSTKASTQQNGGRPSVLKVLRLNHQPGRIPRLVVLWDAVDWAQSVVTKILVYVEARGVFEKKQKLLGFMSTSNAIPKNYQIERQLCHEVCWHKFCLYQTLSGALTLQTDVNVIEVCVRIHLFGNNVFSFAKPRNHLSANLYFISTKIIFVLMIAASNRWIHSLKYFLLVEQWRLKPSCMILWQR